MTRKGHLIVIEGMDGTGKTTIAKRLAETIGAEYTYEPWDDDIRKAIFNIRPGMPPEYVASLFAYDRYLHTIRYLKSTLDIGINVVCDRYLWSNVVYQGHKDPRMAEFVASIQPAELITPDIVFHVSSPYHVAMSRMKPEKNNLDVTNLIAYNNMQDEFRDWITGDPCHLLDCPGYGLINDGSDTIDDCAFFMKTMLAREGIL